MSVGFEQHHGIGCWKKDVLEAEKQANNNQSFFLKHPLIYWNITLFLSRYLQGVQKKGGFANVAFYVELRIFISNSFENRDPFVRFEYKDISERYQEAET